MTKRRLVFLINLLQDVNILRPLAHMAAREREDEILFLVSGKFGARDRSGAWRREIEMLRNDVKGRLATYETPFDAVLKLYGSGGLIIAASESELSAHAETHDVMRAAPPSYVCVTLQHGYECVGFLQNRDHNAAHGENVRFAADIVAGWTPLAKQRSMSADQRAKYYHSGPTAFLRSEASKVRFEAEGLICENLHSVRFNASGSSRDSFMEMFSGFVLALNAVDKRVALRPHPGGKRGFKLTNSELDFEIADQPIYRLDLSAFSYGVSPPSSVLIDMITAGVPVAVWRDPEGAMDTDAYAGLPAVSLPGDVIEFRRQALNDRDRLIERQERYLREIGILRDPDEVEARFRALLNLGLSPMEPVETRGVLVVADPISATQVISFQRPLALSERHDLTMVDDSPAWSSQDAVDALLERSRASWLVLSRYTGKHGEALIEGARRRGVPVIFHMDDDLLDVPASLGPAKYKRYNDPERLSALRAAMEGADLIYASTPELGRVLSEHGLTTPIIAGDVYCASHDLVRPPASNEDPPVLGYMGTGGHGADLEMILPVIQTLLAAFPDLRFETFGSIKPPAGLAAYGSRVRHHDGVADYAGFLQKLASLKWSIGLAPLQDTRFNRCKADTKWVEYASAGIATVASDLPVYSSACAEGAGLLATTADDWEAAIRSLLEDPKLHADTVARAQARLSARYAPDRLMSQLENVFEHADRVHADREDLIGERMMCESL